MRQIVPEQSAVVRNESARIQELFQRNVLPTYGRFDLVLDRGQGSFVWDVNNRRYLDLGGGIAVCALGHSNPEITQVLIEQSKHLLHVSNLYYTEPQGRLAEKLVNLVGPGKVFFCNSGGEANEGLYKLARKFGHEEGRFEILTALNSFHGRSLAGIAATGQDKVKKGFEPAVPGFRHVPFNNIDAVRQAISPATVAVLIESIQGESGVSPATPEFLLELRRLCNERKMLLLIDEVQAGHFRTGAYQGWQRILEGAPGAESFLPDGVSMAKSLGGGFPIGAFWIREPHAALFPAGSHGTTFGGTPLGCAVALRVLEVIERDHLADNARTTGGFLLSKLKQLQQKHPSVLKAVRGFGFMIGLELSVDSEAFKRDSKTPTAQFIARMHEAGALAVPSGASVVRLLPPLNLSRAEAEEGLRCINSALAHFS